MSVNIGMQIKKIITSLKGKVSYRVGMYLTMGAAGTQGLMLSSVEAFQIAGLAAVALSSWELARIGYASVLHITQSSNENNIKMLAKALESADKKSAEHQSYLLSCFDIGNAYLKGYGVAKDYEKAFDCFYDGAKHGSSECAVMLGSFYEEGKCKPKNDFLACYWYEESAFSKNAEGCYHLAKWYTNYNHEKYTKRIVYFIEQACNSGLKKAIDLRNDLMQSGKYPTDVQTLCLSEKGMFDYAIHPQLRRFIFKGGTSKPSEITNAYKILGFDINKDEAINDLDLSQIRKAYHQRIKNLHPDITKASVSEYDKDQMVKLHEAYELLLRLNA